MIEGGFEMESIGFQYGVTKATQGAFNGEEKIRGAFKRNILEQVILGSYKKMQRKKT